MPLVQPKGSWLSFIALPQLPALQEMLTRQYEQDMAKDIAMACPEQHSPASAVFQISIFFSAVQYYQKFLYKKLYYVLDIISHNQGTSQFAKGTHIKGIIRFPESQKKTKSTYRQNTGNVTVPELWSNRKKKKKKNRNQNMNEVKTAQFIKKSLKLHFATTHL